MRCLTLQEIETEENRVFKTVNLLDRTRVAIEKKLKV
jgi:hypothetical protein